MTHSTFPPHSRAQRLGRELFLRTFFGEGTPEGVASRLSAAMEDVVLPPSGVLYRRGDVAEDIYCVVSGRIALHDAEASLEDVAPISSPRPGTSMVDVPAPGAPWVFGERSIIGIHDTLLDRPRARTAIAITEVHLLRLRASMWFDMLEDNFAFACGALVRMATMLEELLDTPTMGDPPTSSAAPTTPPAGAHRRPSVGAGLHVVERMVVLRKLRSFAGAPLEVLASLAELATEEVFEPGTLVCARSADRSEESSPHHQPATSAPPNGHGGTVPLLTATARNAVHGVHPARAETNRDLLVLARGAVTTTLSRGRQLHFGAPALIGGLAALTPAFDRRRILVSRRATILRLPIVDWLDAMEDHSEMLRGALATLTIEREEALLGTSHGPPSSLGAHATDSSQPR